MEGPVILKYSIDAGATWSASHSILMSRCHTWIRPVPLDGYPKELMGEFAILYKAVARLIVTFQCDVRQFEPGAPDGDSLYIFINKLRAAPLIHCCTSGAAIDGFSEFASSANTCFLVPEDTPDIMFPSADGTRFRDVRFTLCMQKEYSITP